MRKLLFVVLLVLSGFAVFLPAPGRAATTAQQPTQIDPDTVVAVQGSTGHLYVSKAATAWRDYGGYVVGQPAVVRKGSRVFYFVRGSDSDVYVRTDTTTWTAVNHGMRCLTPPGASVADSGSDAQRFMVGCVGTDRHLYALVGTLPTATNANPIGGSYTRYALANLGTDSTGGGVGGETGALGLTAVGPVHNSSDAGPNSNMWIFRPGRPDDAASYGGPCSWAAGSTYASLTFLACHETSGSGIVVYVHSVSLQTYERTVHVPIVAFRGPAADDTNQGDQIQLFVTSSDHLVYTTTVNHDGTMTALTPYRSDGFASASPGAVVRVVPAR